MADRPTRSPAGREELPSPLGDLTTGEVELAARLASDSARHGGATPPALRDRILASARAEPFAFVGAQEGMWLTLPGNRGSTKQLFHDSRDRAATRLMSLPAGEAVPAMPFVGSRGLFIVEGSLMCRGQTIVAGDFIQACDGVDEWRATRNGALVLELAAAASTPPSVQRASEANWTASVAGGRVRSLRDATNHDALYLLEMNGRSTLGEHDHGALEELYVLSGTCVIEGREMIQGDYHRANAGSHHHRASTEAGCQLLVSLRNLSR